MRLLSGGFAKIKVVLFGILLFGLTASFFAFLGALEEQKEKDNLKFKILTKQVTLLVQNKMNAYSNVLYSGSALFNTSKNINNDDWDNFVSALKLEKNFPGIEGMGFIKATPLHFGYTDKKTEHSFDTSIVYYKTSNNKNGKDGEVFTNEIRHNALWKAATSAEVVASCKIESTDRNGNSGKNSFLMCIPIYTKNAPLDSQEQKISALQGFVYATFAMDNLMSGILGNRSKDIDLEIYDGNKVGKAVLLFDSDEKHTQKNNLQTKTEIIVGGRVWTLDFKAQDRFVSEITTNRHWYILATGLAISFGFFGFAMSLIGTREKAVALAKQMTKELYEAKERFMLAVNGSNDGIWDWDIQNDSLFISARWKEMLGYKDYELKNEFDTFLNLLHEDDKPVMFALLDRYHNGEINRSTIEFRMRHKDGSFRWILGRGEAVRDSSGAITRMAGSHTDITDIKNNELRLKELVESETSKRVEKEKILIQQSKMAMMGEMIGAIAHQWRQPLNSLGIIVQDVEISYEYGEIDKEYIDSFKKNAMDKILTMSRTIDDFRNFFSPNKHIEDFFVEDAMAESLKILDAQLKLHDVHIIFDNTPENKHKFECNKNELKQVLLNILANAKDAIFEKNLKKPFIKISVNIDNENLLIKIEDSAGGISEDILPFIFDAHFTTKTEDKGTGIGLYMSKQIIEESLKGSIRVCNTDSGAEFTLVLPLQSASKTK